MRLQKLQAFLATLTTSIAKIFAQQSTTTNDARLDEEFCDVSNVSRLMRDRVFGRARELPALVLIETTVKYHVEERASREMRGSTSDRSNVTFQVDCNFYYYYLE